jgi:hypothetical protein
MASLLRDLMRDLYVSRPGRTSRGCYAQDLRVLLEEIVELLDSGTARVTAFPARSRVTSGCGRSLFSVGFGQDTGLDSQTQLFRAGVPGCLVG